MYSKNIPILFEWKKNGVNIDVVEIQNKLGNWLKGKWSL